MDDESEMSRAIEVYESLLVSADSDRESEQFRGSTILAMIEDSEYAERVKELHAKVYG